MDQVENLPSLIEQGIESMAVDVRQARLEIKKLQKEVERLETQRAVYREIIKEIFHYQREKE